MSFIFPLIAGKYTERQYMTASSVALVEPGFTFLDNNGVLWKYVQAQTALTVPAPTSGEKWSYLPVVAYDMFNNTGTEYFKFTFSKVTAMDTPEDNGTTTVNICNGIIINPDPIVDNVATAYQIPINSYIMMVLQYNLQVQASPVVTSEE